jgi:uncharacterized OsmC-like protein
MYSALIENRGDARFVARTADYEFVMGTEAGGANPIDTLLAAFAGCLGHQIRDFLQDHKIASKGFAVRTEAALTADNSKLADVRAVIDLKDTPVAQSQEAALMTYVESCKIYRTLSANSRISAVLQRNG